MAKRQNKAEQAHTDKVAALGCVACYIQFGEWETPGQIHHIRDGQGMSQRSGWDEIICLCLGHHEHDNKTENKIAIHGNSGKKAFIEKYGSERTLLQLTLSTL